MIAALSNLTAGAQEASLSPEAVRALIGACLALSGMALVPLVIALSKYWFPERNHFFARWGFTHFAQVAFLWCVGYLAVPWLWASFMGTEIALFQNLLLMALIYLAPALLIFGFASRLDPDKLHSLGMRCAGSVRSVLFGLSAYALLFPALFGTTLLWPWILSAFGVEAGAQDVMQRFLELEPSQMALPLVLAVLVLPFFEELFFRAFLQPLLVQNFREVGGVALTSALFAALHGLSVFLPVFALALIMGGVMQRTRRFAACWAIHALHNGLILALILVSPAARELVNDTALLWPLGF